MERVAIAMEGHVVRFAAPGGKLYPGEHIVAAPPGTRIGDAADWVTAHPSGSPDEAAP